jgi:S-adenosylmethionine synthetase
LDGWSVTRRGAQQEATANDASKVVGYASLTHPTKLVVPI